MWKKKKIIERHNNQNCPKFEERYKFTDTCSANIKPNKYQWKTLYDTP